LSPSTNLFHGVTPPAEVTSLTLGESGVEIARHDGRLPREIETHTYRRRVPTRRSSQYAAAVALLGLLASTGPTSPGGGSDSHAERWTVAPGVVYRQWDFETAAGRQRVHVLDVNPHAPGVSLSYDANAVLRDRATVGNTLAHDPDAVAGVNGDYFDIGDTGAPLGIGFSRTRGLLHGTSTGWTDAFYQAPDGSYHVGQLALTAQVDQHPAWHVSGLNTPHAQPNSITVYTHAWGDAAGRRVVDGRRTPVREVRVLHGSVVANTARLSHGKPVTGLLLLGLGTAARSLRTLSLGTHVTVSRALDQPTQMAITGSQVLVDQGRVTARADHLVAPRTSVGIDEKNGHVLLVTVDGREPDAVGLSLPGFARLLVSLGVDDAVNLDGGGSSTMVAQESDGNRHVVNEPSLGHERAVADALAVDYAPQ
jgi:hypothetical protein